MILDKIISRLVLNTGTKRDLSVDAIKQLFA